MRLIRAEAQQQPAGSPERLVVDLSPDELSLIRFAIDVVRREIEDEEFSTRLGVPTLVADAFLAAITESATGVQGTHRRHGRANSQPGTREAGIPLSADDLLLVHNALNEVLHGLPGGRDDASGGLDRRRLEQLLDATATALDCATATAIKG